MAKGKQKGKDKMSKTEKAAFNDSAEIHWMSIAEAEIAMKKSPKKVWIDMYTDWCGWCKVMDKKTFTNPEVIRYMNANYYNVKMNAEQKEDITFQGKTYKFSPENRAHELAIQLMAGRMSYPTILLITENFANAYAFAGYQNVTQAEKILRYFNEGHSDKETWAVYESAFVPTWKELATEAPAAGH